MKFIKNHILVILALNLITLISIVNCFERDTFTEIKTPPEIRLNIECSSDSGNPTIVFDKEVIAYWNKTSGANYYVLLINDKELVDTNSEVIKFNDNDGTNGVTLRLNEVFKYNQVYDIKVKAGNNFQYYPSENYCFFKFENPIPQIITRNTEYCTTDGKIKLSFSGSNVLDYTLNIYSDKLKQNQVLEIKEADFARDDTTRSVTISLADGTYYWIVNTTYKSIVFASNLATLTIYKNPIEPTNLTVDTTNCINNIYTLNWNWENYGTYVVESNTGKDYTSNDITIDTTNKVAVWNGTADINSTVHWRVLHLNGPCNPSEWVYGSFIYIKPIIPSNITFDSVVCISQTLDVKWNGQTFGNYIVEINTATTGAPTWTNIPIIGNNEAQFVVPLSFLPTNYTFRIKHTTNCGDSDWVTNSFLVNIGYTAATISGPPNGVPPYNPTVSWTGNAPNNTYVVALSTDAGSTYPTEYTVVNTSFTFSNLVIGSYKWRVRVADPCNDGWHDGDGFFVYSNLTNPLNPAFSCINTNTIINWSGGVIAGIYELEASLDNVNWTSPIIGTSTGSDAGYFTFTSTGSYWWRVRQKVTATVYGNWLVSTAAIVVNTIPTNPAITVGNICFGSNSAISWTTTAGETYEIEYYNGTTYVAPTLINAAAGTAIQSGIPVGNNYKWHIRTTVNGCVAASWTDSANFNVYSIPTNPAITVTNICSGSDSTISWTTTAGETYEIEYYNGTTFVAPTSINAAAGTATQSGIPVGTTYKWHIRTTVNGCVAASWTDSANFNVYTIPTNPAISVSNICFGSDSTISWTTTASETYEIEYYNGTAFVAPTSINAAAGTAIQSGIPVGNAYRWHIRTTVSGCVAASWTDSANFNVYSIPTNPVINVSNICFGSDSTISWTTTAGETYEIEYFDGSSFVAPTSINAAAGTAIQSGIPVGSTYKWHIRTTVNGCVAASWTDSSVFNVYSIPTNPAISVSNICFGSDSTISWTTTAGETYEIEYYNGTAFVAPTSINAAAGTAIQSGIPAGNNYRWHIRTTANGCVAASWTDSANFNVYAIPTNPLINVFDNCLGSDNTVSWTTTAGETYEIEYFDGSSYVVPTSVNTSAGIAIQSGIPVGSAYKWHIRTTVNSCIASTWTDSSTFNVYDFPSNPGIIVSNICFGSDSSITWTTTAGETYEIEFYNGTTYIAPTSINVAAGNAIQSGIPVGNAYSWHIRTTANGCVATSWTNSANFNVYSIPSNPAISVSNICFGSDSSITWTTTAGETYEIEYFDGSSFVAPTSINAAAGTAIQSGIPVGSTYKWHIRTTVNGCVAASWTDSSVFNVYSIPSNPAISVSNICFGSDSSITWTTTAGETYEIEYFDGSSFVAPTSINAAAGTAIQSGIPVGSTYKWHIRTTVNGCVAASWTDSSVFNVYSIPSNPAISVSNICFGSDSSITWTTTAGETYEIEYFDGTAFVAPTSINAAAGTAIQSGIPVGSTYKWHIRTTVNGCVAASWTDSSIFNVYSIPSNPAISVSNICFGSDSTISWTTTAGETYEIEYFDGSSFVAPTSINASAGTAIQSGIPVGSTYKWHIRTTVNGCVAASWTDSSVFNVYSIPSNPAISVSNICFGSDSSITWTTTAGETYEIEYFDGTAFVAPTSINAAAGTAIQSGIPVGSTYKWHIRTTVNGCVAASWTDSSIFNVYSIPSNPAISVSNICFGSDSSISWTTTAGETYEIEYFDGTAFVAPTSINAAAGTAIQSGIPVGSTYKWHIRTTVNGCVAASWTDSSIFNVYSIPSNPAISVSNICLGSDSSITWTTTAGETYEIEYFDGTAFVAPTSINAAAGTAIQSGIPVGSTYKWHIRTTVNGCVAASWTDSSIFNVYSIPSNPAISVSNICFGSDSSISWTTTAGETYEIEYFDGSSFVAPTSINAAAGTAIQSGIPVGSTYKWHIRTTVNGCVAASWTDSSIFNVYSIPSNPAISVSNICFGSDSTISWTTTAGETYEIEYFDGSSFVAPTSINAAAGTAIQSGIPVGSTYKWHIRTTVNSCVAASWTDSSIFNVYSIPSNPAISVSNICFGSDSTISWTTTAGETYEIEYFDGSSFVAPTSINAAAGTAIQSGIPVGSTYKWHIRTTVNGCVAASWTDSSIFNVYSIPSNPAISVSNICFGSDSTISWTTTAGETYEIEYFDGSSFVAPTSINAAAGTAIQSGIAVGSTYKWHIRTTVNGCVAASWTDSSVFNVYSIPSNPAISVSNICFGSDSTISWTTTAGETYEIEYFDGSSFVAPTSINAAAGTAIQSGIPVGSTYKWHITNDSQWLCSCIMDR